MDTKDLIIFRRVLAFAEGFRSRAMAADVAFLRRDSRTASSRDVTRFGCFGSVLQMPRFADRVFG